MKFKKDDEGKLVLDDNGDPIAIDAQGETIPLDKVVSLGKHQRIEGERDEYKAQAEKLTGQIAELQKTSGDKEELAKQLADLVADSEKTKADFETKMAARDKEHALDTALLKAGVKPDALKGAKAYVDLEALKLDDEALSGLDLEAFKKDKPYLFGTGTPVDSAAPSRGTGANEPNEAQLRTAMGLEKKE
jgi:hypothetical protein